MPIIDSWVDVDLDKFSDNVRQVKNRLKKEILFIAVVKDDAYGYGVKEISEVALNNGADWLAVTDHLEGEALRKLGIDAPVFIMVPFWTESAERIVDHSFIPGVDSLEQVSILDKISRIKGKTTKVHVKIDTGLRRFGLQPEEAVPFVEKLAKYRNIFLEGIYTHFASPDDDEYTQEQFKRIENLKDELDRRKILIKYYHCGGSPAVINSSNMQMNAVRVGSLLYRDCFQYKTVIKAVKKIGAHAQVGYHGRFVSDKPMRVAILPVGVCDGLPVALSNKGHVLIRGRKLPMIGFIGSGQVFVDLTKLQEDPLVGEEVVIIGSQGREHIKSDDISKIVGSRNFEVNFRILQSVPRFYISGGVKAT